MRLRSIASGSSGNCIYIGSDSTHLLVDVGISGKRVEEGVHSLDLPMDAIDAILVTHEHADHIAGLGVIARRYSIPIYLTGGTMKAVLGTSYVGKIDRELFHVIRQDERFTIKDITVNPMKISHDAAEPVAYRFAHGKQRAAIVTDLGTYNDYTVECLKGMDALFLEANHD
ncbi:MAG: MBL fold metallo-hydrolase, partial [Lachnospiraceae bacterium]|nr:MBL fold metallo-hydrolase [Lachnospiraceae bacterium]